MQFSFITKTLILNEGTATQLRNRIKKYFHNTFSIDELLYKTLARDEAFYLRADPLRHPLIFYFGHTAVFIINKLIVAKLINKRINPEFESMFAIGVDEMSWDDLNLAHYTWPKVSEVQAYRDKVRALVDDLISRLPLKMPITWDSPWWALIMAIEHAHIHLETSSVLIRQLPLDEVQQLKEWAICTERGKAPENKLIQVIGGKINLGKGFDNPIYGWDNEFGKYSAEVSDFKASKYLCSNFEYLEFIKSGGYETQKYWTEEGWAWKTYQKAKYPRFWISQPGGDFKLRTMASMIDMPWNWPVEVNYLEAKAFCNWKAEQSGKPIRLPSEEEWYHLRDKYIKTDQPYWDKAPGNINLEYWASSCPVERFNFGEFYDLIGNVWQWTETPIYGFPGFHVHPYYDDFSVPTFDGKHNLIKGGSWISTGNEATRDSRYAFRRHFYQHAGFRYVESDAEVILHEELYETDPEIILWCNSNWGTQVCSLEDYSSALLKQISPFFERTKTRKALNIGCKTGRTSFELARYFDSVVGLDLTARLIKIATEMKEKGYIRYTKVEEGDIVSFKEKHLWEFGLEDIASRLEFMQADPSNLLAKYNGYDLIVAENVLSRTNDPRNLLKDLPSRLNKGGILVVADCFDWDEAYTPKENWIGGVRIDGEPMLSTEALKEVLQHKFERISQPMDVFQLLRKNSRTHQLRIVQVSVWQKL